MSTVVPSYRSGTFLYAQRMNMFVLTGTTIMITERWTSCCRGIWSSTSKLWLVFQIPPELQRVRSACFRSKLQNGWEDLQRLYPLPSFFALSAWLISHVLSLRYTWIYWSWRPGCRASCCTLWEPSLSTWSPKRRRVKTRRINRSRQWRGLAVALWGTQKSVVWLCLMNVLPPSDLMYLYHIVPHPHLLPLTADSLAVVSSDLNRERLCAIIIIVIITRPVLCSSSVCEKPIGCSSVLQ